MSGLTRMYRGETDIDFPKLWKPMLAISSLLVLIGAVALITSGLNLAIDFRGGAVWDVPSKTMTVKDAQDVLDTFGKKASAKIQVATDQNNHRILQVQASKAKNVAESEKIGKALADKAKLKLEDVGTNTVGPSWGAEITKDALKALIAFLIVITMYISWQLEWRMAASALVGVVHDIIITVGVYAVFRFDVTPATVISFLTILGYSLYDTIVVYDRVQENTQRYDRSGTHTYTAIMRRSLNQTLMRSTNTTTVALLPVISILVVGGIIGGQTVMFDFALALLVGLLSGAYSSVFVAAPVVVWLKEREDRYRRVRQRARDRGVEATADRILLDDAVPALAGARMSGDGGSAGDVRSGPSPLAVKAAMYQRPHPPRPRKTKK